MRQSNSLTLEFQYPRPTAEKKFCKNMELMGIEPTASRVRFNFGLNNFKQL